MEGRPYSDYGLTYLRDKCPCASAPARTARRRASRKRDNPFQMYKPALKMLSVEPVGNYAIRIIWSDGHNSGIYSYEHFRRICQCAECQAGESVSKEYWHR